MTIAPLPAPGRIGTHPLPSRPALRDDVPFLWRSDTELEIGEGERALVIQGADTDLAAWALGLDGRRGPEAAIADAERRGIGAERGEAMLAALAAAGALDDAAVRPACLSRAEPGARMSLLSELAAAAHAHGTSEAAAAALDRRASATVHVVASGPVADVRIAEPAVALLRSAGVCSAASADRVGDTVPHLVVLARVGHPDVPVDEGAAGHAIPHLPIGAIGARAVVGPLVLPGAGSCLRCASMHSADRDPAWPRLAAQLEHGRRRRGPAAALDSTLAAAAASHAVLMALAWIDAGGIEAFAEGRSVESAWALELRLPGGLARRLPRPAHPLCGCRWTDAGAPLPPGA